MRFRHADGSTVHLAYCTNVHPAEDLSGVIEQLARFAGPAREALGIPILGVGLWLPADLAARLLADPAALSRLRDALATHQLEVVTFNGFPYRAFHAPVVKQRVYQPDWTEPDRLRYTLDLAELACKLLPADAQEASVSTLPLGWRAGWTAEQDGAARRALRALREALDRLSQTSGRRVRVGIEPEPGCVVETTRQAAEAIGGFDGDQLGVCLDACHLAVQFEDAEDALCQLAAAGVPVVKAQVSAALRAAPTEAGKLARFAEPRYLHQTRERSGNGTIAGVDDLDRALAGELPGEHEWRVHFHVPVHADASDTTQPQLRSTLAALLGGPKAITHHLEVETYTWTVLPSDRRPTNDTGLAEGIACELRWTRDRLLELGLDQVTT
ncbi:MAG: metabolite traffic protein EboE [Solirubrobacteraceae bacterium]